MRFLSVFAAGLAAFAGLLSYSSGAHAAIVDCVSADIQAAVAAAAVNETIHINAGECPLDVIIVVDTDGLTIEGAGPLSTILMPRAAVGFRLEADDVTFKNMTIRAGLTGIRLVGPDIVNTEINNVGFLNNNNVSLDLFGTTEVTDLRVIDSHFQGIAMGIGIGIHVAPNSTVEGLTITGSTFDDYGVALDQGNDGSPSFLNNLHVSGSSFTNVGIAISADEIRNSIVEHSTFSGNDSDIALFQFIGAFGDLADGVVIRDNVFMNSAEASIFLLAFSGAGGIGPGGITIENNTFIQIVGIMSQNVGRIDVSLPAAPDRGPVTIRNNNISFFGTFSGGAGATAAYGIRLIGNLDNISIQGNQIDGGGVANGGGQPPFSGLFIETAGLTVNLDKPLVVNDCNTVENFVNGVSVYNSISGVFGGLPAGVIDVINNNNIAGNSDFGVNNAGTSEEINARSNWWGDADGPGGAGDAITANVAFGPFLVEPCSGGSNNFLPNNFLLYDLVSAPGEAALSPLNLPVEISDQFDDFRGGPLDKIVGRPVFLANPASKNGEGVADPSEHLVCYLIRSGGGGPVNVDVLFTNQFTDADVGRVKTARLLCVPSTKEVLED